MAAHRYWRLAKIAPFAAGDLELSAAHLYAGASRVDDTATISASSAPSAGAVTDLQDADLNTEATWPQAQVNSLSIAWDFGSGGDVEITRFALGSTDSRAYFPMSVRLQYSDDSTTWVDAQLGTYPSRDVIAFITWPGARAMTGTLDSTSRWNVNDVRGANPSMTFSTDRKTASMSSAVSAIVRGVTARSSGVRQFEIVFGTMPGGCAAGVSDVSCTDTTQLGAAANGWAYNSSASKRNAGSTISYGATWAAGDVIGVVVDFSAGTLTFYKNGVSQGVAYTSGTLSAELVPSANWQFSGSSTNVTLKCDNFTHPIAGATAWGGDTQILTSEWSGHVAPVTPVTKSYGGAAADYSGVMLVQPGRSLMDFILGGTGRIQGTVKVDASPDIPVRRRVRLIREIDGMLVSEQWSDATTGAYDFQYVQTGYVYTVISYDHTLSYRAVVADRIAPEPMP